MSESFGGSQLLDGSKLTEFFTSIELEFIQNTISKYKFTKSAQQWPISDKEKKQIEKFQNFLKEVISDFECMYGDKYESLTQNLDSSDN